MPMADMLEQSIHMYIVHTNNVHMYNVQCTYVQCIFSILQNILNTKSKNDSPVNGTWVKHPLVLYSLETTHKQTLYTKCMISSNVIFLRFI